MKNHQLEDASIYVPKVMRAYLGEKKYSGRGDLICVPERFSHINNLSMLTPLDFREGKIIIDAPCLGGQSMKAQFAIFILMAYPTTGAFAQNVQVPVDLVKRQGNLRHFYHEPETIYYDRRRPAVKEIPNDQPDGETTIEIGPEETRAPGKTVLRAPAGQPAPRRAGKTGNFDSNISQSGYHPAGLQPGQTSRLLSGPGHNYSPPKAGHGVARAAKTQAASGQSSQTSKTNTEAILQSYPPSVPVPAGTSGGDQRRATREVSGTLKPGDLIHSAQNK